MFWCNKELLSALWSSYLFCDNKKSKSFKVFNPGLTSALYIPMLPVSFGNESSKRCGKWSLLKVGEINQEPHPLGWPLMPLERQGAMVHSTVWRVPCGGGHCKRHGHKCALCRGVNSDSNYERKSQNRPQKQFWICHNIHLTWWPRLLRTM